MYIEPVSAITLNLFPL